MEQTSDNIFFVNCGGFLEVSQAPQNWCKFGINSPWTVSTCIWCGAVIAWIIHEHQRCHRMHDQCHRCGWHLSGTVCRHLYWMVANSVRATIHFVCHIQINNALLYHLGRADSSSFDISPFPWDSGDLPIVNAYPDALKSARARRQAALHVWLMLFMKDPA
jgi:hypothetical protein